MRGNGSVSMTVVAIIHAVVAVLESGQRELVFVITASMLLSAAAICGAIEERGER